MSFAKRAIDVRFELGTGAFGSGGFDAVDLTGLRVLANIQRAGGLAFSTASVRVYGASRGIMNHLTTLGQTWPDQRQNKIILKAGDEESGMAVVFGGQINEAYLDMSAAPDGVFAVNAFAGLLDTLRPLPPYSSKGQADAAVIVSSLANQMGYGVENNGVTVQLSNPYYVGTGRQQLEAVARAGNFEFCIDDTATPPVLAIWPKGSSRANGAIPLISPDHGLVGYPAYAQNSLKLTTLYNPNILANGLVQVQSSILAARGKWRVYDMNHDLESELQNGKWFSNISCNLLGHEAPLGR